MRLILLMAIAVAATAFGTDCSFWERFSEKPLEQIALPDTHVSYWRYRFEVRPDKPFVLRVSGSFPHGRYMNYNVYDQLTLDSTASISDVAIEPDAGSVNPFRPTKGSSTAPRNYTLWVLPRTVAPGELKANWLRMPMPIPDADPKAVELWYRIYDPDPGAWPSGPRDLPRIEAFADLGAQHDADCPARAELSAPLWRARHNLSPAGPEGSIVSFAPSAQTMYANADTRYLMARFNFRAGEVAYLRMKAPPRSDVRYWSICLGGADTRTSACLADDEATLDRDGWLNLVIGPPELKDRIIARGMNFLPRPPFLFPFLIYRHLLERDSFAGAIIRVPQLPKARGRGFAAAEPYEATRAIGDYAPRGRHCSSEEFFENACGFQTGEWR